MEKRNKAAHSPDCRVTGGFTLVELSIVLVILGLLIGFVMQGRSLIRASELRTVGEQYMQYVSAVQAFRGKYFALPGDMTNATAFWGTAVGCPGSTSSPPLTCNGNGNGLIGLEGQLFTDFETVRFWQHLANAKLIEGSYNGRLTVAGSLPAGKITTTFWAASVIERQVGGGGFFDGIYGNSFQLGSVSASPHNYPWQGPFKPEEVWNIDTKLDDGLPAIGKLVVYADIRRRKCSKVSVHGGVAPVFRFLLGLQLVT